MNDVYSNPFSTTEHGGIQPAPAVRSVIRHLLRGIFTGSYAPGEHIREVALAKTLNVSRAPVREALRILEQDGLLAIATGRGARVIDPTPQEIADQFVLLSSIYSTVARLAVRHASDEALQAFFWEIDKFEENVRSRKAQEDCIEIAFRVGAHLGQCCGSSLAEEMLRKLGRVTYLQHRYLLPMSMRWQQQAIVRLRKLAAAVHERSELRAEKAAQQVVANTASFVLRRVTKDNNS